jgi:hypothetical protein
MSDETTVPPPAQTPAVPPAGQPNPGVPPAAKPFAKDDPVTFRDRPAVVRLVHDDGKLDVEFTDKAAPTGQPEWVNDVDPAEVSRA